MFTFTAVVLSPVAAGTAAWLTCRVMGRRAASRFEHRCRVAARIAEIECRTALDVALADAAAGSTLVLQQVPSAALIDDARHHANAALVAADAGMHLDAFELLRQSRSLLDQAGVQQ